MAVAAKKNFDSPDQHVEVHGIVADVVEIGEASVVRSAFGPGVHCPQIAIEGKPRCLAHHTGFVVAGHLHVELADGSVLELGPNDVFDLPPGHDGWATGDVPVQLVNWAGYHSWLPERGGERVLVTLVVTDIVDSTKRAAAVGDATWRRMLADHNRQVRSVLDRYHGREITTTGDGFLALFDGAARAVNAALAIRDQASRSGLAIRAGVHSGEVEVMGNDVHGVAVNEVTRIAAAAAAAEVLVSATTQALAAGAGLVFEERGTRELKGLPGPRVVYAAAGHGDNA
ncbi:MAG: hypothetical protein M3N29_03690 [Chloroflexota bacterium]|nr:hypothetical protein [Chloroflexota bacterium]